MNATQQTSSFSTARFDLTPLLIGLGVPQIAFSWPSASAKSSLPPSVFPLPVSRPLTIAAPSPVAPVVEATTTTGARLPSQLDLMDATIREISVLIESHFAVCWADTEDEVVPLPELFPLEDLRVCRSIMVSAPALQEIVRCIARTVAEEYQIPAARFDDLMFAGNIGLYRAEGSYDSQVSEPFRTFLRHDVRGAMIALLQNNLY